MFVYLNNFIWKVCGLCCTHKKKIYLIICTYIFGYRFNSNDNDCYISKNLILLCFYVGFDFLYLKIIFV